MALNLIKNIERFSRSEREMIKAFPLNPLELVILKVVFVNKHN